MGIAYPAQILTHSRYYTVLLGSAFTMDISLTSNKLLVDAGHGFFGNSEVEYSSIWCISHLRNYYPSFDVSFFGLQCSFLSPFLVLCSVADSLLFPCILMHIGGVCK
jgi:hypothetical protein